MKIETWPIDRVIPYARNSRTHSPEQVAAIAGSIDEFGFVGAIVVRDGTIAKGHGTLAAVQHLIAAGKAVYPAPGKRAGAEPFPAGLIPVQDCSGWSDSQFRAYVIADNRLAESAGWDRDMLALEVADLETMDFDLDLLGFDAGELDVMLSGEGAGEGGTDGEDTEPQVDRAGELRALWGVESGQLWALVDHRLLCGDSTQADDVERVMGGDQADLCFTSPPYGQQRDYRDGGGVLDWDVLMRGVFGNLPMADDGQVLVNLGLIHRDGEWVPYWDGWLEWMRGHGWRRFGLYVWDQGPGLPGDWAGRLAPAHEFLFHLNKKSVKPEKIKDCIHAGEPNHGAGLRSKSGTVEQYCHAGKPVQDRKIADSILRISRHKARGIECAHAAVFPVELPAEFMASWPGMVYEPFSGSGTTIIAGENLNRRVRAIEISPAYVAVALQRWSDHTGKTPVLLS